MKSFHLKWASHLPNMGAVFSSLFSSEGLSDVCLSCCDGSVRAHKLLLSTCSHYFLELFLESSSKRTVVVLPGVKIADLKVLLSFIYTGEVSVTEEGLAALLEVAEMLGVRGLKATQNKDEVKVEEEVESDVEALNQEKQLTPDIELSLLKQKPKEEKKEDLELQITKKTEPVKREKEKFIEPTMTKPGSIPATKAIISLTKEEIREPEEEEVEEVVEEEEEEEEVKHELIKEELESSNSHPYPGLLATNSQYSYMPPYISPLVSMSNLAAMYQQQQQQHAAAVTSKQEQPTSSSRPLEHYRQASQGGTMALDLLPEDINCMMTQSTTPHCPICTKDCANFPNLRSHLQVHNSIRPYACTFCEAKFARISHLNRHIRTHTGERPFGCEQCGKSFARQDKLKMHMDRHIGDSKHLLGLISPNPSPSKKPKLDKGAKNNETTMTPVSSSAYSSMLGHSSSLWSSFQGLQAGFPSPPTFPGSVYPSMVYPTSITDSMAGVMKIGECSVKAMGTVVP